MPIFSEAQNTVISDSQFTDYTQNTHNIGFQLNVGLNPNTPTGGGIKLLLQASAPEAAHDSFARGPPPRCFPGTRTQYINDITSWALDASLDQKQQLFWIRGPAGVGKTALAQTCAEHVKAAGALGATFFFSSSSGRNDHKRFFTTLAYQLSTSLPPYRELLDEKIRRDETLLSKSLARQFEELISRPLEELARNGVHPGSKVIFVDGLDECVGSDVQVEIIHIIAMSVQRQTIPFRWAVFSRPEPHLEAIFSGNHVAPFCLQIYLPVSRQIDGEIRAFLWGGFQDILQRHNLSTTSQWPSESVLNTLVIASAGLFVYAATILRFVGESGAAGPDELLQTVLASISSLSQASISGARSSNPFAALDAFYTLIMQQIPDDLLPLIQRLILLTHFSHRTQDGWIAIQLGNLLGTSKMKFTLICNRLHAVLRFQEYECNTFRHSHLQLPSGTDCLSHLQTGSEHGRLGPISGRMGGKISFYHKSFIDFLNDPERSGKFCIQTPEISNALFARCLQVHSEYIRSYHFPVEELESLLLPTDTLPPWKIPTRCLPFLQLADGVDTSASSLHWSYRDECLNAFLKVHIYRLAVETIIQLHLSSVINRGLLQRLEDVNYRQMLRLYSTRCDELEISLASNWDRDLTSSKNVGSDTPYITLFGAMREKLPEDLRQGKIIRSYSTSLASKWKSLFSKNSPRVKGKTVYILGHGDHKLFLCQSNFTEYLISDPFQSSS